MMNFCLSEDYLDYKTKICINHSKALICYMSSISAYFFPGSVLVFQQTLFLECREEKDLKQSGKYHF